MAKRWKRNSKTHIVFDRLENHHHRVSHESNINFVVAYKLTGVIPFNKCSLKSTKILYFVEAFKFEHECKIKYENDFSILVVGFAFSRHIPISCHDASSLPKTSIKITRALETSLV